MDVVRLRTLAYKSILGFGKYHDFNVKSLVDTHKTVYLRWVYYNCDMISFLPDILDEIHIPNEYRIEKPGKNPELYVELNEKIWANLGGFTKFKQKQHRKKVKKGIKNHNLIKDSRKYSKANLQARNHGH